MRAVRAERSPAAQTNGRIRTAAKRTSSPSPVIARLKWRRLRRIDVVRGRRRPRAAAAAAAVAAAAATTDDRRRPRAALCNEQENQLSQRRKPDQERVTACGETDCRRGRTRSCQARRVQATESRWEIFCARPATTTTM
uniref:Uncharacterized protein n=1 Tax=Plectus sambesii TaxID=2011161 RepID=A0A914VE67_9BILA